MRRPLGVDLSKRTWLGDLVAEELSGYDPPAARLHLPPEVREARPNGLSFEARARILVLRSLRPRKFAEPAADGEHQAAAFLAPVRGHLALLLDLGLLQEGPFDVRRRRAELAAFFATAAGEPELAARVLPRGEALPSEPSVLKAFARGGAALRARGFPPGDPLLGIRLYPGTLSVTRRLLGRIAIAYWRKGTLDRSAVAGYLAYSAHELAYLAEAQLALAAADGPLDAPRRRTVERQLRRLGLPRPLARDLRSRVAAPRSAAEIARAAPARMRPFLVEQLLLASVGAPETPARQQVVSRLAEAAQLGPERLAAMKIEAAAFHADHEQLFRALGVSEPEWRAFAAEWEEMGDQVVERVAAILFDNLEAIVTELKQTGELGQLLAKATSGRSLTPEEKRKVKDQLLDLARAVPALAIFAAPGGMLLLPLLAKLLPFQLLPSAFVGQGKRDVAAARRSTGGGG